MDIGKRLKNLRETKSLSQGDIEKRSGLLRSYISRVEGGYTAPSLATLEKFAKAMNMEPYQVLLEDGNRPRPARLVGQPNLRKPESRLVKCYESMSTQNRKLLMTLARKLARL